MKKKIVTSCITAFMLTSFAVNVTAKVRLQSFVTDSMVVQQQSRWTVTGHADGDRVTVTTSWNSCRTTAVTGTDGKFTAVISTPKAGGPYTICFDDGEVTRLNDIWSGEVWLCSGQSNMEMPVGGWGKVRNYRQEIADAQHPEIRLLQIAKNTAYAPIADAEVNMGGWRTCSPATVENFSSIAYFFAREMSERLGVHVGVIDCTWGGTPAEAWTSLGMIKTVKGFENEIRMLTDNGFDKKRIKADYEEQTGRWMELAQAEGEVNEVGTVSTVAFDNSEMPSMPVPGQWENTALPNFNGIVYMQHTFEIPQDWAGKPIELHLGCIDDEDVTYFNGEKIAEGAGYNVRRVYSVPAELVKAGRATVTVRVTDFEGEGGIYGDADDIAAVRGTDRITLTGDWQYRVIADFGKLPRKPVSPESSSFPTVLYNAMLHPLHTMPVKGVLWYQGCANVGRAEQYSSLFRKLITDWRKLWNNDRMLFYFVQLAAYLRPKEVQPESEWAALRAAQADALRLDNTAMAVAIDVGDSTDIHPKNKQEVAHRLALIALRRSYGMKDIVDRAPMIKSADISGNTAILTFDGNITIDGSQPKGFIVETDEGQWSKATAAKTGKATIALTSDSRINAIRYNWADYPDGNLRGVTGLPVAPFATDRSNIEALSPHGKDNTWNK